MSSSNSADRETRRQGDKETEQEKNALLVSPSPCPRVLILGLGNPLLSDDGVGWRVAEELRARINDPRIEIDCHAGGGLSLMERLIGYDRAIIIDAINTGQKPQGTVDCFGLEDLPQIAQSHLASAHETTLHTALQVGRAMGAKLPTDILIVAVEAQNVYDFSEELSPAVASAVPQAVEWIIRHLVTGSRKEKA